MNKIPEEPGTYLLMLHVPHPLVLQIGRLGVARLPAGQYLYVGSAMNGLRRRLRRHLKADKLLHWHIDYLLTEATPEALVLIPSPQRLECTINRYLIEHAHAEVAVKGFGASDCRCPSHLLYIGQGSVESVMSYLLTLCPSSRLIRLPRPTATCDSEHPEKPVKRRGKFTPLPADI